jgi:hypothetical protein
MIPAIIKTPFSQPNMDVAHIMRNSPPSRFAVLPNNLFALGFTGFKVPSEYDGESPAIAKCQAALFRHIRNSVAVYPHKAGDRVIDSCVRELEGMSMPRMEMVFQLAKVYSTEREAVEFFIQIGLGETLLTLHPTYINEYPFPKTRVNLAAAYLGICTGGNIDRQIGDRDKLRYLITDTIAQAKTARKRDLFIISLARKPDGEPAAKRVKSSAKRVSLNALRRHGDGYCTKFLRKIVEGARPPKEEVPGLECLAEEARQYMINHPSILFV